MPGRRDVREGGRQPFCLRSQRSPAAIGKSRVFTQRELELATALGSRRSRPRSDPRSSARAREAGRSSSRPRIPRSRRWAGMGTSLMCTLFGDAAENGQGKLELPYSPTADPVAAATLGLLVDQRWLAEDGAGTWTVPNRSRAWSSATTTSGLRRATEGWRFVVRAWRTYRLQPHSQRRRQR